MTATPYSYRQYAGNGSTTSFAVPFPYLLKSHVHLYLGFNLLDGTYTSELVETTGYTWTSGTQIQTTSAPASGQTLTVIRQTPNSQQVVQWQDGSTLIAADLNTSDLQNLYVVQEQQDRNDIGIAQSTASVSAAAAAISTANTALSTANASSAQSATALSQSSTALSQSSTAVTSSAAAVSTANSSNAVAATASTNASAAVASSSAANTTAASAVSTANAANIKADAAIAAVASSVNYTAIATVAAIPSSPANNTYIEIADSTGLESFTPLTGKPVGFVGDGGLSVRLRYTTTPATWSWLNYYPNNSDARYLKLAGGTMTGALTLAAAPTASLHPATKAYTDAADATLTTATAAAQTTANTAVTNAAAAQTTANAALPKSGGTMTGAITLAADPAAALQPATKQYVDSATTTLTTAAAAAQTTANAALPKAGGTMTGNITFAGTQPTATTSAAGIVQLTDSTSSTSTTTAATPGSVKSVQDFAQVVSTTANAAMPKVGGTFTGDVTFGTTTAAALPVGTTAQRPTGTIGQIRYNSTLGQFEGFGTAWSGIGGGAVGGSSDRVFVETGQTITSSYTISTGYNAVSAGPVAINSGVNVVIPSGASWVIV